MVTLALIVLILAAVALLVEVMMKRMPYFSLGLVLLYLILTHFGGVTAVR